MDAALDSSESKQAGINHDNSGSVDPSAPPAHPSDTDGVSAPDYETSSLCANRSVSSHNPPAHAQPGLGAIGITFADTEMV
jgi:hypothetical protein